MADYTATAIAEGDHWVIDVPDVGTTQAETVDELEEMALDLIVAMTHTAPEDVHISMRIV
jgi:predicted RNase H-like HicB family nuclease